MGETCKSRNLQKLNEKYPGNESVAKILTSLRAKNRVDVGDISGIVDLVEQKSPFLKEKDFKTLKNEMEKKVSEFVENSKQYFEDDNKIFEQESLTELMVYCHSKLSKFYGNFTTDEQFNKNTASET